jgi:hypothetical protein
MAGASEFSNRLLGLATHLRKTFPNLGSRGCSQERVHALRQEPEEIPPWTSPDPAVADVGGALPLMTNRSSEAVIPYPVHASLVSSETRRRIGHDSPPGYGVLTVRHAGPTGPDRVKPHSPGKAISARSLDHDASNR